MNSIHSVSLDELKQWLIDHEEKPFRASQIFQWLYGNLVTSWQQMANLPRPLQESLAVNFSLSSLALVNTEVSSDSQTVKFLWKLHDEKLVESVLIIAPDRRTVCVSSQVGCPARCAFCASGKEGLIRSLSAHEIFEQVLHIQRYLSEKSEKVTHIVFMGMGEPLENYDAVVSAIRLLCDPKRLHLSERRITVSTVGVIEGIERLALEELRANLVLSLHAPSQHVRKKIIPYARKYEITEVIDAMLNYSKKTGRDITYEYTLIKGINDSEQHAKELAALVKGHPCTINLIPYNPVDGLNLQRPEKEAIEEFRSILESQGHIVTWRYTKGKDIAAACGQLALKKVSGPLSVLSSS